MEATPKAFKPRENNFGLIRLALASLVVLSHAPELLDGTRVREPLTQLFHTLSFGELAVDGFFLVSGFLIVKSWEAAPELRAYLEKRVLRIYPGFVVASLVSVLVVGTLVRTVPASFERLIGSMLWHAATLRPPSYPTPLAFRHAALLNGALWTIRWEFGCYLLVAVMGLCGLTRLRWPWAVLALGFAPLVARHDHAFSTVGLDEPAVALPRFAMLFSVGALFYLYRERVRYTRPLTVVATLALAVCMLRFASAQIGAAAFGGYVLFALAFAKNERAASIGSNDDVSYGLYLYAWPIQQLLVLSAPDLPLAAQVASTLVLSLAMGWASWRCVERTAMRLKPRPRETPATAVS